MIYFIRIQKRIGHRKGVEKVWSLPDIIRQNKEAKDNNLKGVEKVKWRTERKRKTFNHFNIKDIKEWLKKNGVDKAFITYKGRVSDYLKQRQYEPYPVKKLVSLVAFDIDTHKATLVLKKVYNNTGLGYTEIENL